MKFSIIIPLYNKAAYICKALESVFAQTFTDWECIVIDDGSTDESVSVVNQFVEKICAAQGKMILVRQQNAGVSIARNKGVLFSHGEYVCFLDADDWWKPNFLAEINQLISEFPDAGLYASNYIYYKLGKTHIAIKEVDILRSILHSIPNLNTEQGEKNKENRGYLVNYPRLYLFSNAMPITSSTVAIRRKIFDEVGGFYVGVKLGEDFLLWSKVALKYRVAFLNEPLAYYNNDIPAAMRATHKLYAPNFNMLWHLQDIESSMDTTHDNGLYFDMDDWKVLLDRLRVKGLLEYWLSNEYHTLADEELKKVDWSKQSRFIIWTYRTPIRILRVKQRLMHKGSRCKQFMINLLQSFRVFILKG